MLTALELLKHPVFLSKLGLIKRGIYKNFTPLKVEVAVKEEPFSITEGKYTKIKKGDSWGKAFTCAQFHVVGELPVKSDKEYVIIADIGGEGQLYDNDGNPSVGVTNRIMTALDIFQAHKGKTLIEIGHVSDDKTVDFYIDAGFNGMAIFNPRGKSKFKGIYLVEIDKLAKAFYYDCLTLYYQRMADKSCVDIKLLDKAQWLYFRGRVADAKKITEEIISKVCPEKYEFYAVGHSHLDLAWLWPIRETKRKAARTFSNQINHIEKYPNYIYGASQPQQLVWLKEKYPDFFERIKKLVADGRIEIQGGMWVEPDTNISSGEALIRQIFYGQQFWMENFGKVSNICWLPDVFGYNGNLPQILKKCGIENFMTIKLSWNVYNKFPYNTFNWQGIDGSEILVHMPPANNYNGDCTPVCLKEAIKQNKEKNVDKGLYLFGAGDGGGGPSEAQLELLTRQSQYSKPNIKFTSAEEFFKDLRASNYNLPSFRGELYLEKHQGTYTTQGKTKRYNRLCENLLQTVESVWTHCYLQYGEYPKDKLDKIWKEILLYQFHDILPGSSINRVYRECNERYASIVSELYDLIRKGGERLGGSMGYFNTAPMNIDTCILDDGKCIKLSGKPYSSCLIENIEESGKTLKYSDRHIENGVIKLDFKGNGAFDIIDLENGKYLGEFNKLNIYSDPYSYYNAWDIAPKYLKRIKIPLMRTALSTKVIGKLIIREQILQVGLSHVTQRIILEENSKLVKVESTAVFRKKLHMLRMDSRPTIWADEATFDIQFGNLKRSTKNETSKEKAQYEVCAHKYVDINNGEEGITVINDCKYGYRVKDGLISMNLIRKPIFPDKSADVGEHKYCYAFYPYKGKFEESGALEKAYEINRPVIKLEGEISSLFDCVGDIVVETVKKGVLDGTVALRAFEPYGKETKVDIKPLFQYKNILETDLLENNGIETSSLGLHFAPYEIKTLVFFCGCN